METDAFLGTIEREGPNRLVVDRIEEIERSKRRVVHCSPLLSITAPLRVALGVINKAEERRTRASRRSRPAGQTKAFALAVGAGPKPIGPDGERVS